MGDNAIEGADSQRRGEYLFIHHKPIGAEMFGGDDVVSPANPLGKPEGVEGIIALEYDVADPDLQRIASAVTASNLKKDNIFCEINGGWSWGLDDLNPDEIEDNQYGGLAGFIIDYLRTGNEVTYLSASEVLGQVRELIEAKGSERREVKPYQPTEEEEVLYQRFDELRDRVTDYLDDGMVFIYRSERGDGFHLDGNGKIGVKFDMAGYDAGKCTPENVWEQYKNQLEKDDLTRKEAVEMAITRFEEILSMREVA